MIKSLNPATGEFIKEYEEMSIEEVNNILQQVNIAQKKWEEVPFEKRAAKLRNAAKVLREKKEEYSQMMTAEMGKPITQSRAEVDKCAAVCDFYTDNGEQFLSREEIKTDASSSFVAYRPLGIVLAVMPWNFPFWQVFRFAAPGLMAGNAGVLKHASNVSGCSLNIENVFLEAGFPEFIFKSLIVPSSKVEAIIKNDLVKAVTLTGSVNAGKAVAANAGKELKKSVLELGGSDPYIVLEDADLELAAETCVNSRLINSGQSCIAAKRFIVVEEIYEKFEKLFVDKMKRKKMGDPLDESVEVGPQATVELRNELHEQVKESVKKGARVLLGGEIPESKGAFYPPTILANVVPGMPAYDDELFGPVASLIKVKDEKEAVKTANDSIFGLGAAIFTNDVSRGERIAEKEIDAGNCFVNAFVRSDPRLPFGGVKQSGYGRELSMFGIREFCNIKTVYIK
jgi:succinate-semialdehyde dehydrogenase / glutarate-semialdehyde dehydrogenase